ncbi:unnamed protein product [Rodentolepis nana]|uniref:Uncharacterized protein n=1 Tax=Rodentolepis nana TaxID=102285 RepID=A0A0R3TPX2_RODNA|nr:unnamed protein product [Rodentolepis nana]
MPEQGMLNMNSFLVVRFLLESSLGKRAGFKILRSSLMTRMTFFDPYHKFTLLDCHYFIVANHDIIIIFFFFDAYFKRWLLNYFPLLLGKGGWVLELNKHFSYTIYPCYNRHSFIFSFIKQQKMNKNLQRGRAFENKEQ